MSSQQAKYSVSWRLNVNCYMAFVIQLLQLFLNMNNHTQDQFLFLVVKEVLFQDLLIKYKHVRLKCSCHKQMLQGNHDVLLRHMLSKNAFNCSEFKDATEIISRKNPNHISWNSATTLFIQLSYI